MKVNMTPNPLDVVTIHASQGDTEARQWEFELHNNGELIDTSEVTEQLFFKAYKGGTEQLLPENTSTPTTSPFLGDIRYPQGLLTDQEFTYRQSPAIQDGIAKIESIKGNTIIENDTLIPFNGTAFKTVGFNQWDEEWENGTFNTTTGVDIANLSQIRSKNYIDVMPNTSYFVNANPRIWCLFFDSNKEPIHPNVTGYTVVGNSVLLGFDIQPFTTPQNARYMRFYCQISYGDSYKNDICININNPSKNGTYEPYISSTLSLPISTYFPTGMKSAGTVYDELTEKKAITRIGSRAYQSGDESDTSVITDGTTTYYALVTPTETSFTTASLVTENAEIPLSNEDGTLIGKCTEQLSENPGFFDVKIKLADADGTCYSNKIQLHVERKPS